MPDTRMYWIHALTPVHVGTGSGLGFIDLPIAREKTTNWPLIPGSGIKGVLSAYHGADRIESRKQAGNLRAAFGVADDAASSEANSGALVFTDARLVCFPVRSLYGTFAWISSPLALRRLSRDLNACGHTPPNIPDEPSPVNDVESAHAPDNNNPPPVLIDASSRAFLGEAEFVVTRDVDTRNWTSLLAGWIFGAGNPWSNLFQQRFLVVRDDIFTYFSETSTEVSTRIHVDPATGTVATRQLWTEEALPAESILAGVVWCDRIYHDSNRFTPENLLNTYCNNELALQVGGKATVGRGRVRAVFTRCQPS
ncbi:MAG: type III-B CRISPR module RAMP protein Cmr4 [Bryobacterales bacterium]|nr:type III-B CRISPR module RAMP protein Cmr4 [Bryobacterales bacterium]